MEVTGIVIIIIFFVCFPFVDSLEESARQQKG
jgi:hypothetical protein